MPKIATRQIKRKNSTHFTGTLYFFQGKSADGSEFFFALPDGSYETVSGKVEEYRQSRGPMLHGFRGKTEAEAVEAAQEYADWYVDNALKIEKFILISTQTSRTKRDFYSHNDRTLSTEAKVSFEFDVLFRETLDENVQYKRDLTYHDRYNGEHIGEREVKAGTLIPFTEEQLKTCERLVEELHAVNDKILLIFGTPENAIAALSAGNAGLKLLGGS